MGNAFVDFWTDVGGVFIGTGRAIADAPSTVLDGFLSLGDALNLGCQTPPDVPAAPADLDYTAVCDGRAERIDLDTAIGRVKADGGTWMASPEPACTSSSWHSTGCTGSFQTVCLGWNVVQRNERVGKDGWSGTADEHKRLQRNCNSVYKTARHQAKCDSKPWFFAENESCRKAAEESGYKRGADATRTYCQDPENWASDFCHKFCDANKGDAACLAGYEARCQKDNLWLPPSQGGDARCWSFASDRSLEQVSALYKDRCTRPGALADPACFGEKSAACSLRSKKAAPFTEDNRYGWCSAAVEDLCKADGYKSEVCACVAPFTQEERNWLRDTSVAEDRYCVGVSAEGGKLHGTCRSRGYVRDPEVKCQDVCTTVTTALGNASVGLKDVTLNCEGERRDLVLPTGRSSVGDWAAWWKDYGANYGANSTPTIADFARDFVTAVGKATSPAALQAARAAVESARADAAAAKTVRDAIDARLLVLGKAAAIDTGKEEGSGAAEGGADKPGGDKKRLLIIAVGAVVLLLLMSSSAVAVIA